MKVIFWQDLKHNTNISIEFCTLIYHIQYNIPVDFILTEDMLYEIMTNILYHINESEEVEEGGIEFKEDWNPHQVLSEEEFEDCYFKRGYFVSRSKLGYLSEKLIKLIEQ